MVLKLGPEPRVVRDVSQKSNRFENLIEKLSFWFRERKIL
jgi:hypothetical protein